VVVVAAIDALRGGGEETHADGPPARTGDRPEHDPRRIGSAADVEALVAADAFGELVATDHDCHSSRLLLPELTLAAVTDSRACSQAARTGWVTINAPGDIIPPSCLLRDAPAPQGCGGAVLPEQRVRDALGAAGALVIEEVAWLSGWRAAVIVRDHERRLDVLVLFDGARLVSQPRLASPDLAGLSVGPRRSHVAVRPSSGGVFVLDAEGQFALPGRFRFPLMEVRTVAWSPDERWAAIATRDSVILVATDPSASAVVDLPIAAIALEWRGGE
jgi:hypothetical protein